MNAKTINLGLEKGKKSLPKILGYPPFSKKGKYVSLPFFHLPYQP